MNGSIEISALIDTGAAFSLMDAEVAMKLPNLQITETHVRPIAANNAEIRLTGQAFVQIQVGDIDEVILVQILRNSATPLILGTNFLPRFKRIELRWRSAETIFRNEPLPCTGMVYNPPENRGVLSLSENVVLPPRTIRRFMVPVNEPFNKTKYVWFEPFDIKSNIFAAAAICAIKDKEIPVQIINNNTYPVILNQRTKIGTLKVHNDNTEKQNTTPVNETSLNFWIQENLNIPSDLPAEYKRDY